MTESATVLAPREAASQPQSPERGAPLTNKEREVRQLTTEFVSRVITGSVNTDASRFDSNNISPLTTEEKERISKKSSENLAYDKANILSFESRAAETTTYAKWKADFENWTKGQMHDEMFHQDGRAEVFQAIGLLDVQRGQDGQVQYTVNVQQVYDRYLNKKSDIKRFIEDVAADCKDDGSDTINLTKLQAKLIILEPVFIIFGEKNRADLLVRDFAKAHGLLSQSAQTKQLLVQQIESTITTPIPEHAEEKKYLDALAKIAVRSTTADQSLSQPEQPPVTTIAETVHQQDTTTKSPEVDFGHGKVQMIRVTPAERGEEAKPPLLFVQGHLQDRALEGKLHEFANTGRDSFGVAFTDQRVSRESRLKKYEGISVEIPQYQLDKAEDMLRTMDELAINQTDVVATSEGALRTMIAVALRPEKFRNILLVHPAGMDDRDSIMTHLRVAYNYGRPTVAWPYIWNKLQSRFSRKKRVTPEDQQSGKNNKLDKRAEQRTVARSKFHTLIDELGEAHPHLRFMVIGDEGDKIYPAKRLQKVLSNSRHLYKFVTSHWGRHGIKPGQETTDELEDYLTEMEQSRVAANASEPQRS